jgi:hypothetical protein
MDNKYTIGIEVKFKQGNGWSRAYTYLYHRLLPVNTLVVVSNNDHFYSIARVKNSIVDYKCLPGINYKKILEELKTTYNESTVVFDEISNIVYPYNKDAQPNPGVLYSKRAEADKIDELLKNFENEARDL